MSGVRCVKISESTKVSLEQKLREGSESAGRSCARYGFATGVSSPMSMGWRLTAKCNPSAGYASIFGFAIYLWSKEGYEDSSSPPAPSRPPPRRLSTAPVASTSATPPLGSRVDAELH